MLSREKKPGSRTAVRAVCSSSSTGEDWSFADPLHPPRGATLDLVPGLAAGDHTRPDPCLVFLSASPSGRCSSVSLQTATGCCKNLTPTVVLGDDRRPLAQAIWYECGQVAETLVRRGATLDLELAAGMGRTERLSSFFDAGGKLLPSAGRHHPPVNAP